MNTVYVCTSPATATPVSAMTPQARQNMEALRTTSGSAAHDFNNILNATRGHVELARQDAREGSALRRYLDNIMCLAERVSDLVDRIRAFNRPGFAEQSGVAVERCVEEALELLQGSLPSNPPEHEESGFGCEDSVLILIEIDNALLAMRNYLLECAAHAQRSGKCPPQLVQMTSECLRRLATGVGPQGASAERPPSWRALRRAIRYVNENLDSKLRWNELGSVVGLGPVAFARHFKLAIGMTPHQYIIRCRLQRAMKLLSQNDLSLAEIALEVGCSCQSHLTTLFRKHLDTTPGAYRVSSRRPARWQIAIHHGDGEPGQDSCAHLCVG